MTNREERARRDYDEAVANMTHQLVMDYATLPTGDFQAHERALAEARRLRVENSPEKRIAKMTDRQLADYIRDHDDAARERAQRKAR